MCMPNDNGAIDAEKFDSQGKFALFELAHVRFPDGTAVIAPSHEVALNAKSVAGTIGDIIDIACKLFPKICGVRGGGGCYVIIGPDGTKITICPPGGGVALQ